MNRRSVLVLIAGLASLAGPALAGPDPVAFVADLVGSASIEGNGRVQFLGELTSGTRLLVGSNSSVVVTFSRSGTEFTATGPGEFSVQDAELKADRGAPPVRRTVAALRQTTTVAAVSRMATASVRMRNLRPDSAERPPLAYPVETMVTSMRPAFRWTATAPGPQSLAVVDSTGKVVYRGPAQSGVVPAPLRLQPGHAYRWSVSSPAGSLGEARFETVDAQALSRVRKSGNSASFSGRVSHAMLLQEVGAKQEAQALWAKLAQERPDLPELAALQP